MNGLVKSDGFSHLFNFASAAFAEQTFPFFTVRNAGFLSYGHIPESGFEQLNEINRDSHLLL